MRRVIGVITMAVLVAAFAYIVWLNPTTVEFRYSFERHLAVQLGWLLILAFLAGIVIAVLGGALRQLVQSLRQWPEHRHERRTARVTHWTRTGVALSWEGELQRARNLLRKAWRRQPRNTAAALALAASHTETGEDETARRILQEAISRDAGDVELRCALGEVNERLGDTAEAIRILETVRVQHPHAPRALLRLRALYCGAARWREAADVQQAYLQSLPPGTEAPAERSRLTHLRYQAAVTLPDPTARMAALSAIVQADRQFLPAFVSLGDALVAAGKKDEALRLWERSLRNLPRLVLVERLLAHQNAPADRERAVGLLKKHGFAFTGPGAQVVAAREALTRNDLEAAVAALSAVEADASPVVRRLWARVYRKRNQFPQALDALEAVADQVVGELTGYRCAGCQRVRADWTGYCPDCQRWDTYHSVAELPVARPS